MSMFTIWALFGITQVEFFILLVMQIRTGDRLEAWIELLKAVWKKREECNISLDEIAEVLRKMREDTDG